MILPNTMRGDPEILHKIYLSNEKSFTEAFDSFYPALCFYADKYLHDMDESRSLVQQVFVDLWLKRDKIDITQSIKSYLFKTVRNYALDRIRHQAVEHKYLEKFHPDNITYDNNLIEEAELNARINSAINELPPKCREIFLLCRFEEMKYLEIAKKLDISVKTVEMQMGIALKKLRFKLTEDQNIQLLLFIVSKNN